MRLTANICAASSGLLNMFTNIRNAQTNVADLAFPSFTKQNNVHDCCWVCTFMRFFEQMYHLHTLNCVYKSPCFTRTQNTNSMKPIIHGHYFIWQLLLVIALQFTQLTKLWCSINNMLIRSDTCVLAERQYLQYLH